MASRRSVLSSSRGSQTKANKCPLRMLRTSSSAGRGRSASDIAMVIEVAAAFLAEIDQQVARHRSDRVAQRLAAMALGIEAELLVEFLEPAAQQRHFLGRLDQRLAGPQAGMNADAGDLAAFADRHDDQVERHAAMDGRLALRLGDQRHRAALLRNSGSPRPSRPCRSARRGWRRCRARWTAPRPAVRPHSRAGSSRRRRTS